MLAIVSVALSCVATTVSAQPAMPGAGGGQPAGMPDARMMSGIPMPVADLPDGTVSVRVVRGEISSTLPGQQVELVVNGKSQVAKTDRSGHAQFSGLAAGSNATAAVTVGGERVESQPFVMPEKGGVRLLLAAVGAGAASTPGLPPVVGTVTFGGETRIVVEFDDDSLNVFYLIEVVNNGAAPVNPATPIVFDLPAGATSPTVLEGSSPQAQVKGTRVSIVGPFKPGRTSAQVAYQLIPDASETTLVQRFPVALETVSVEVQQVGGVQLASGAITAQQQVASEGKTYLVGAGPALGAGRPLTLDLAGLPHHAAWPRTVALGLAIVVLCAGLWAALGRSTDGGEARRRELEGTRERLFADLLRLERSKRSGTVDASEYAKRRAELLAMLERVYGELDVTAPAAPAPQVAASTQGDA